MTVLTSITWLLGNVLYFLTFFHQAIIYCMASRFIGLEQTFVLATS